MEGCGYPLCARFAAEAKIDVSEEPDEAARTAHPACVLSALSKRSGLELIGAMVTGPLRLDYQNVDGPFILRSCRFDGITAKNATFKNVVDLTMSRIDGDVDFTGAKFERVLLLDDLKVAGGKLTLWSTRLDSGLCAHDIIVAGELDAREMNVVASADFQAAIITGPVTFRRAHVAQTLGLEDACCIGEANFNGAVTGDIALSGATFAGDLSLRGVHAAETLRLNGTLVVGGVTFDECDVRELELGRTSLEGEPVDGPQILGEVSFVGGSVHTLMTIATATFRGAVRLEGLHVGGWRWRNVGFRGALTLTDVRVERSLKFSDCRFAALDAANFQVVGTATFEDSKVDRALTMTSARFSSDVTFERVSAREIDLAGTNVAGNLIFKGDHPDGPLAGVHALASDAFKLENVAVAQDVELGVHIRGKVEVRGLNVLGSVRLENLRVDRAGANANDALLGASFLTVGRDVTFGSTTRIAGPVDLIGAKVAGTLKFHLDALPCKISLNSATLGTLAFNRDERADGEISRKRHRTAVAAEQCGPDIDLDGCTYDGFDGDRVWLMDSFHVTDEPIGPPTSYVTAWAPTRNFTGWSPVRRLPRLQPFLQLEKALRNQGNDADANAVFYQGQTRTRWKTPGIQWFPQSIFTGYGVKVWRLGVAILLLWALATVYFASSHGAVRALSLTSRTSAGGVQSLDDRKTTCALDRASPMQAALLALELFVPTTFPDRDVVVAPACEVVTFAWVPPPMPMPYVVVGWTLPAVATSFVVFSLKLGGLILIPLAVVIVSGVLRPSARA